MLALLTEPPEGEVEGGRGVRGVGLSKGCVTSEGEGGSLWVMEEADKLSRLPSDEDGGGDGLDVGRVSMAPKFEQSFTFSEEGLDTVR